MDQKTKIMKKLQRASGMSLQAAEHLKEELHRREWWVRCWNCRRNVEGSQLDTTATCPHCGVVLSQRRNGGVAAPIDGKKRHINPVNRRMFREDF